VVICLFAHPETILKRTIGNPKRPLLNVEDPEGKIRSLMEERDPVYMSTGVGISAEGRTIQDIVKNIIRVYHREGRARRA
jgi:shikimate kinase